MRFVCFVNDLSIRKLSDPILPSNGREQKLGCVNSSGGGVGDGVKILSIVFFLGRGWGTQAINLEVAGDGKEDEFFRTFLLLLLLVLLVCVCVCVCVCRGKGGGVSRFADCYICKDKIFT